MKSDPESLFFRGLEDLSFRCEQLSRLVRDVYPDIKKAIATWDHSRTERILGIIDSRISALSLAFNQRKESFLRDLPKLSSRVTVFRRGSQTERRGWLFIAIQFGRRGLMVRGDINTRKLMHSHADELVGECQCATSEGRTLPARFSAVITYRKNVLRDFKAWTGSPPQYWHPLSNRDLSGICRAWMTELQKAVKREENS